MICNNDRLKYKTLTGTDVDYFVPISSSPTSYRMMLPNDIGKYGVQEDKLIEGFANLIISRINFGSLDKTQLVRELTELYNYAKLCATIENVTKNLQDKDNTKNNDYN